jgi:hypothetical protein
MRETDYIARVAAGGLKPGPVGKWQIRTMTVEPRMTLLDALREELALTGTKKRAIAESAEPSPLMSKGRRILSA